MVETDKTAGETTPWVIFHLGEEEYGVSATQVQEVVRFPEVTHVPNMPSYFKGVVNLRGKILPILDMKERFAIPGGELAQSSRRVIVSFMGEQLVGIIVDSVSGVIRLGAKSVEPLPSAVPNVDAEYILGIGKVGERLIVLLNLEKMLGDMEKKVLKSLKSGADAPAPGSS